MRKSEVKIYFFIFALITIIVLLAFAYYIFSGPIGQYFAIRNLEKDLISQAQTQNTQLQPTFTDPAKGPEEAKVTLTEYCDIFTPGCKSLQADLLTLEQKYPNDLKFVFKGVPLNENPENQPALLAAYCAGEQNKFWDYKDLLYSNIDSLNAEKYTAISDHLKLNPNAFSTCLAANKYQSLFIQNTQLASAQKFSSLPSITINQEKITGKNVNLDNLIKIIDQNLK